MHSDADWSVPFVRSLRFRDRVKVDVDDFVEIPGHHLGDILELLKVVSLVRSDEHVQGDRGQITDGNLVLIGIFDDLRAKVTG